MSAVISISFCREYDNDEDEYILLKYTNAIDFINSENERATREIQESNHFVSRNLHLFDEKRKHIFKLMTRGGITAGLLNQYLIQENFKKADDYYKKYVDVLRECDEYLEENFSEGEYLDVINNLNGDRKNYEKLMKLNKEKYAIKRALTHLMNHDISPNTDIFI